MSKTYYIGKVLIGTDKQAYEVVQVSARDCCRKCIFNERAGAYCLEEAEKILNVVTGCTAILPNHHCCFKLLKGGI